MLSFLLSPVLEINELALDPALATDPAAIDLSENELIDAIGRRIWEILVAAESEAREHGEELDPGPVEWEQEEVWPVWEPGPLVIMFDEPPPDPTPTQRKPFFRPFLWHEGKFSSQLAFISY